MRHAACSGGSRYVSLAASYSTMPLLAMDPSHSRTYRSWSPARAREFGTAGRTLRCGLEQTGAIADVDHGAQHGAGVDAEQAPGKLLHTRFVDGCR